MTCANPETGDQHARVRAPRVSIASGVLAKRLNGNMLGRWLRDARDGAARDDDVAMIAGELPAHAAPAFVQLHPPVVATPTS